MSGFNLPDDDISRNSLRWGIESRYTPESRPIGTYDTRSAHRGGNSRVGRDLGVHEGDPTDVQIRSSLTGRVPS